MATVSISVLASEVAAILGETLARDCNPEESPFPDLEQRTRLLAPVILTEELENLPLYQLSVVKNLSVNVTVNSEGMASVTLPEDFFRLASVKMSDWKKPVTEITSVSSEKARRQSSRWKGIRGTPDRPLAISGVDGGGRRVIMLYSSGRSASLEHFAYVPLPAVSAGDTIDIPDVLRNSLPLKIALRMSLPLSSGI